MTSPAIADVADPTIREGSDGAGGLLLEIAGRLESRRLHGIWTRATKVLTDARKDRVTVDAAGVTYCDSSGAAMLRDLENQQREQDGSLELRNFPDEFSAVLDLLTDSEEVQKEECPIAACWPEMVGRAAVTVARDAGMLVGAIGEIFAGVAHAITHPASVRWDSMFRAAQRAGVNSLPVVLLVSGLLGMILAFQSAPILHTYGADIVLANMIGLSFLRELGPLMTAVILTARSGSAFAAELGTMKINEEVDALHTMGVDPVRFLVIPRVLAAIIMTPLLTVFANLAGIVGGFIVWSGSLDLSLPAYLNQLEVALRPGDFYTGLVKSVVFGTLIAGIGCIRGMQTRGSASAVGQSTTSAVVSGIVLIALADALFTIVFHYLEL